MTAVQWFANQLGITSGTMLEQAKEIEKQQIIDAHLIGLITSLETEATKQATEYFAETYESKGSDTPHVTPQVTPQVTPSQEISDEEIEKFASDFYDSNGSESIFIMGAKWYREQLKSRQ